MTNERRDDIILIALVLSIAIHVVLMFFVRPQVMTEVTVGVSRAPRHAPMRVSDAVIPPDPVKIEEILDLKALKDAPPAKGEEGLASKMPELAPPKTAVEGPAVSVSDLPLPEPPPPARLEAPAPKLDRKVTESLPVGEFAAPPRVRVLEAPALSLDEPTVWGGIPAMPEKASAPMPDGPAVKIEPLRSDTAAQPDFTPSAEVYEKVDAKIVEQEKAAVRRLVDAEDAEALDKAVNVTMSASTAGKWTYFKVTVLPRSELPVVPKDVVVLIDASGSIGRERMGSIRGAAKQILRSVTNSGDRFNLVAFRNRYSYAFRTWQDCTQRSFDQADKWIGNLAAHGRTDVFATISSVLTLPRDPARPLIALVVTDGDANAGVSDTAEIISRFTALNDGLISVYMYGVRSSANRELIDVLTHGNRGESFIFDGWRGNAGSGIEGLSTRFRDPVLSDLRVVFPTALKAEAYPRRLRNLYRDGALEIVGRVPAEMREITFSLKGLNGKEAYESFFTLPIAAAPTDGSVAARWDAERALDEKLR